MRLWCTWTYLSLFLCKFALELVRSVLKEPGVNHLNLTNRRSFNSPPQPLMRITAHTGVNTASKCTRRAIITIPPLPQALFSPSGDGRGLRLSAANETATRLRVSSTRSCGEWTSGWAENCHPRRSRGLWLHLIWPLDFFYFTDPGTYYAVHSFNNHAIKENIN